MLQEWNKGPQHQQCILTLFVLNFAVSLDRRTCDVVRPWTCCLCLRQQINGL